MLPASFAVILVNFVGVCRRMTPHLSIFNDIQLTIVHQITGSQNEHKQNMLDTGWGRETLSVSVPLTGGQEIAL